MRRPGSRVAGAGSRSGTAAQCPMVTGPGQGGRRGGGRPSAGPPPVHLHASYLSGFVELLLQPCHRHDGMLEAARRAATDAEMWRGSPGRRWSCSRRSCWRGGAARDAGLCGETP